MSDGDHKPDDITREQAIEAIRLLEPRRAAVDASMWHGPGLTMAAQAFLLIVLTNRDIPGGARLAILVAGVAATATAMFALIRLRAREVEHSDAIRFYCDQAGIPDPSPSNLPSLPRPSQPLAWPQRLDKRLREKAANPNLANGYLLWVLALGCFIVADIVGLLATSDLFGGASLAPVFDVLDLFAVGIGCDFAGAYLLGRGLLKSPRAVQRLGTWGAVGIGAQVDAANDHVEATVGVASLLVGFALQAIAYGLVLGVGSTSDASGSRALVGALAAVVPCVAILVGERATHRRRLNAVLLRVGVVDGATKTLRPTPAIDDFVKFAEWLEDERLAHEDDAAYVARVFRVDVSDWPPTWNPPRTTDS